MINDNNEIGNNQSWKSQLDTIYKVSVIACVGLFAVTKPIDIYYNHNILKEIDNTRLAQITAIQHLKTCEKILLNMDYLTYRIAQSNWYESGMNDIQRRGPALKKILEHNEEVKKSFKPAIQRIHEDEEMERGKW